MYGYIYMTINIFNGKRYIGKKKSDRFLANYKGRPSPMKGRKLSDEHKRKMLESRQRNKNQSTIES